MNALLFVHLVARVALALLAALQPSATRKRHALALGALAAALVAGWQLFDAAHDPAEWLPLSALRSAAALDLVATALLAAGVRLLQHQRAIARTAERAVTAAAERARDEDHAATCRRMGDAFAHRVRDVLAAMRLATDGLGETLRHDPDVRPQLRQLQQALAAWDRLANELAVLTSADKEVTGDARVNAVLADVAVRLRSSGLDHLQIDVQADADDVCVCADPTQLARSLWRLVGNAVDAMPTGGAVALSSTAFTVHPRDSRLLSPGRWVCMEVRDTGAGMSAAGRRRALEPFFSTSGGQGLGLPAVSAFAAQCGGRFELKSRVGAGTVARLLLPAGTEATASSWGRAGARRAPARPATTRGLSSPPRVLVAEDAEPVRVAARRLLERMGCRVVTARDGREALSKAVDAEYGFDLVLTDVAMPRLSGVELRETLLQLAPSLPVVFMTDARSTRCSGAPLPSDAGVISKPFGLEELRLAVHMAMHASSATAEPCAARRGSNGGGPGAPTPGARPGSPDRSSRPAQLSAEDRRRAATPAPLPSGFVQSPSPSAFHQTQLAPGPTEVSEPVEATLAAPQERARPAPYPETLNAVPSARPAPRPARGRRFQPRRRGMALSLAAGSC